MNVEEEVCLDKELRTEVEEEEQKRFKAEEEAILADESGLKTEGEDQTRQTRLMRRSGHICR